MAIGSRDVRGGSLSEINVTPLVDVMLVLLIIFMVSAPMITRGIEIGLPKAVSAQAIEEERITVTVNRMGQFFVGQTAVVDDLLVEEVKRAGAQEPDTAVYLQGDADVPYGRVLEAMEARRMPGGRMAYELRYFGASTGRWSGGGGLNLQNLNRKTAEGVDLRRAIGCSRTAPSRPPSRSPWRPAP
ncbi:MAG: ExbD/TolR family protein [Acidobacteria bacterium]|nr:ExbD/TolR family protein [Acidobacteriota bacterium]